MKHISTQEAELRHFVKGLRLGKTFDAVIIETIVRGFPGVHKMLDRKLQKHGWKVKACEEETHTQRKALPSENLLKVVIR